MPGRRAAALILICAWCLSAGSALAAGTATPASAAGQSGVRAGAGPVYLEWQDVERPNEQSRPAVAPKTLTNDGGIGAKIWGLNRIRWHGWGSARATATALWNPERTGVKPVPVTVTVSHIRNGCIGSKTARFYGVMAIKFPGYPATPHTMEHGTCG